MGMLTSETSAKDGGEHVRPSTLVGLDKGSDPMSDKHMWSSGYAATRQLCK